MAKTVLQRTLSAPVEFSGIGLHTGETTVMTVLPAPDNHGYKFQRIDLPEQPIINADADLVVGTQRGTTLEQNGVQVHTTEHILAALYGCEVDNALIQLTGPEIPIMDGSAQALSMPLKAQATRNKRRRGSISNCGGTSRSRTRRRKLRCSLYQSRTTNSGSP